MGESSHNFRTTDIWRRPQTEELVDVHVYVVPSDKWIEQRKLAKRDIIDQAVSSGFVRVIPSTTLLELRSDIREQLGSENVPEAFVFLRGVGRNFAQVKSKQELELKVRSFLPPYAEEPEIYVKEGQYTLVRSASLGVLSQIATFNNSADSTTACSTSSDSQTESRGDSLTSSDQDRRALSLDRRESRTPMSSIKTHQQMPARKPQKSRTSRPPTPRVQERSFAKAPKYRSSSKASVKLNESIRESPTEQIEENGVASCTLNVETDAERVVNSPPPRPQSESQTANNSDIQIPVPTPTPTPQNLGKNDTDISKSFTNNDTDSLPQVNSLNNIDEDKLAKPAVETGAGDPGEKVPDEAENSDQDALSKVMSIRYGTDGDQEELSKVMSIAYEIDFNKEVCYEYRQKEDGQLLQNNEHEGSLEQCQRMFDNMHSKMGDDVIVDPIKMLQGEGESLKNAEENGRDHYDEGFHSGELVASEEDTNSIVTLGSSEVKEEDELLKPIRAATPMPRSSSFYKTKMDPEIQQLQTTAEDMRAERRLRELKRDALMQKIRDLQRRKASSKDRVREEWRRRFHEVKKSSPRLEDHCSKLRQELEKLVKDMLVSIKADADSKPHKPSKKTSYKIMIMRLLQEVEDLRRRLQSVAIRLNAETKLRAQAEFEVKKLRQDLLHKKTQVTLTRKQTAFPQTSEQFFISAV